MMDGAGQKKNEPAGVMSTAPFHRSMPRKQPSHESLFGKVACLVLVVLVRRDIADIA